MLSPGTFGHEARPADRAGSTRAQMIFALMIQRTNFGNSNGSSIREAFQDLAVQALQRE